MQPMRFAEFARKLPAVFDTLAKQGDFLVEKGEYFSELRLRRPSISLTSGQTITRKRYGKG